MYTPAHTGFPIKVGSMRYVMNGHDIPVSDILGAGGLRFFHRVSERSTFYTLAISVFFFFFFVFFYEIKKLIPNTKATSTTQRQTE